MKPTYESPLASRYASKTMLHLFSPDMRYETWRRLWVALARAEHTLGLPITQAQVDELAAHVSPIDYDVVAAREKEVRHDVMAHIYAYGLDAPGAKGVIHLGATSCYVTDNADLILYREALRYLERELKAAMRNLCEFADRYAAMPALAYTHYQPAQLTTIGKRASLWLQDLMLDLEEVQDTLRAFRFLGCRGTTGTEASFVELFDGDMAKIPQIVIFIDELADMMLVAGKEVEDSICRLAQMGRAAGMHLVVATQRPTTDVITGLIKANIPSRIALSVKSQIDSRTIIDMAGADKLLGNGDMLYMPIGTGEPVRVQGCFASNKDISATIEYIKSQVQGEFDDSIIAEVESFVPVSKGESRGGDDSADFAAGSDEDYVERDMEVAVNAGQLSTSMLQRKLKLGYARAARIMDELEEMGVIGPSEGAKPRRVLMSKMQYDERKLRRME